MQAAAEKPRSRRVGRIWLSLTWTLRIGQKPTKLPAFHGVQGLRRWRKVTHLRYVFIVAPVAFYLTFRATMYDRRTDLSPEDAPPVRRIEATVKWFNASKGFGFVAMTDGSPDAFLPMAILRRAGYEDVREGASITFEVSAGAKGPLVTNVLNVDNSTAVAPQSGGFDRRPQRPSTSLEGAVKWFEPDKGYGFISPDGGGKD